MLYFFRARRVCPVGISQRCTNCDFNGHAISFRNAGFVHTRLIFLYFYSWQVQSLLNGSLDVVPIQNKVSNSSTQNNESASSKAMVIPTNKKNPNRRNSSAYSCSSMSKTPSSGGSTPSPTSNAFQASSRYFFSGIWGSIGNGSGASSSITERSGGQRRLFVMRHAERMDLCFGRAWTTRCIDRKGGSQRDTFISLLLLSLDKSVYVVFAGYSFL